MRPKTEGDRNALLALHFMECDERTAGATRAHVEGCASCREYLSLLAGVEATLRAWADERPPEGLGDRVLARAVHPARQAAAPSPVPSAMPLFALLPVLGALLAAMRHLASWLPTRTFWPRLDVSPLLETVIPFGAAAVILLVLGGLGTLAIAPALVLETAGSARRGARLQE